MDSPSVTQRQGQGGPQLEASVWSPLVLPSLSSGLARPILFLFLGHEVASAKRFPWEYDKNKWSDEKMQKSEFNATINALNEDKSPVVFWVISVVVIIFKEFFQSFGFFHLDLNKTFDVTTVTKSLPISHPCYFTFIAHFHLLKLPAACLCNHSSSVYFACISFLKICFNMYTFIPDPVTVHVFNHQLSSI